MTHVLSGFFQSAEKFQPVIMLIPRYNYFGFFILSILYFTSIQGFTQGNPTRQIFNQNWISKTFNTPTATIPKILDTTISPVSTVMVDTHSIISPVLKTHFGVNTPFRNGSDQMTRSSIYNGKTFGLRFPAGSGSNLYFFDGNIPANMENYIDNNNNVQTINGINGLQASSMTPEIFINFKNSVNGVPIVVVNYFYARYGITSSNTRAARVQQAADYAAAFVHRLNIQLNGNVKYWEIGNECYGKWEPGYNVDNPQIGTVTGTEYGEDFSVFANAMKAIDPTIKVGVVLKDENDSWNATVLPEVEDHADFISVHNYFTTENQATAGNILGSVGQIHDIKTTIQSAITNYTNKAADYFPIALTEYNARGPYNCSMVNGLFITQIIGEVIKNQYGFASLWVSEWNWNSTDNESKGFLAKNDPEQANYTARQSYIPFYYYSKVFGDNMVSCQSGNANIKAYASTFSSGHIGLVLVNTSNSIQNTSISLYNGSTKFAIDKMYWYEMYANTIEPTVSGYKKFYINDSTSTTSGGGPSDLDAVKPYESVYYKNSMLKLKPYSVIFLTLTVSETYIFEGTENSDWQNANNWNKGCVPPVYFNGDVIIAANCVASGGMRFLLSEGANLIINSGVNLVWKW
jgi:hypothetical protein